MKTFDTNGKRFHTTYSEKIIFTWAREQDGVLKACHDFYTCKDYMTDAMYQENPLTHLQYNSKVFDIDWEQLSFIVHIPFAWQPNIPNALNILNAWCKENKFKSVKIEQVTNDNLQNKDNWFHVTGSKQWMKNTFMASTFLTAFRLALFFPVASVYDLEKEAKDWYKKNRTTIWDVSYPSDVLECSDIDKDKLTTVFKYVKAFRVPLPRAWKDRARNKTGYKEDYSASHSRCGCFYAIRNPDDTNKCIASLWKAVADDRARNQTRAVS